MGLQDRSALSRLRPERRGHGGAVAWQVHSQAWVSRSTPRAGCHKPLPAIQLATSFRGAHHSRGHGLQTSN
jgi:hypothetical protein